MTLDEIQAALTALGITDDKYILRIDDEITDDASFKKAYNVVTGILNGNVVESTDKSLIPVTWDQVSTKNTELKAASDNLLYREQRQLEYPPLEEQLDKIYHSGVNAWKADIKAIKDKYPKPS
tara:strand:- start:110 stop:478 length:369 start_codon:yes stop_codon:yes gene_type:complete